MLDTKNINKKEVKIMSEMGSISGKLQREGEVLRELNDALLVVEADALGRSSDFGYSEEDISKSHQFLMDFASRLCSVLKQQSQSIDLQPVVHHLKSGMKPVEDWIEDIEALIQKIQSKEKLADEGLVVLEDILSLLDTEFTEDLQRLYTR